IAPALSVERCLEWSARLREVGLEDHCPLIAKAYDTTQPTLDRLKAAAAVTACFEDDRARGSLSLIGHACPDSEFEPALTNLNELCPALLEPFIVAAVTDGVRGLHMSKVLHKLGAHEEAVAVIQYGVSKEPAPEVALEAARWLDSIGLENEAASIASPKQN